MNQIAFKHFTIQDEIIQKAQIVLNRLGLTQEQAIILFFEQVALQENLPFAFEQPNAETLQAFKDSEQGIYIKCNNAQDLFEQLGI